MNKNLKKIQYSVYRRETGNAGGKAKNDVMDILEKEGFSYSYKPSKYRPIRIIQQLLSMLRIPSSSILVVQYPMVSLQIMPALFRTLKRVSHSIAIVHDLRALQTTERKMEDEIAILNAFQYVIVHNEHMMKLLHDNGCTSTMIPLGIFDYLHDEKIEMVAHEFDSTVCIAGNLGKSEFIKDLGKVTACRFNLYGIQNGNPMYADNIFYKGLLKSDEIVYKLETDYGLIWDGTSINTCEGLVGKYLMYNNPHKLSLYVAAGKPVITWSDAAIADFVKEHGIGIVVDSLEDLNGLDLHDGYEEMKQNVQRLKTQVANGVFMRTAIQKILQEIGE